MAPVHLHRLLDRAATIAAPSPSFRLLAHAGAPTSDAVKRRAIAAFPTGAVWEFYGATEGQFTACSPEDWLAHPGTVGRARPGRTLTADDDGVIWCDAAAVGPVHLLERPARGPTQTWRGDAFTVGDIGRLDDDGFLYLDGRRDDLILSGGVNVYPAEVERALLALPGVDDAAVFPRVDDAWGQRVCAAYVGPATHVGGRRRRARERVAGYKRPKELHVVAEIPRSANGKVRRALLAPELGLD